MIDVFELLHAAGFAMALSEGKVAGKLRGGPVDLIPTAAALGAELRGVDLRDLDEPQFAALQREVKRVVSMTWWGAGRDFR